MDEVFIRIQGEQHYLWRAVGRDGVVLDILVQRRRDAAAAKRFFKRLLKGLQYMPRVLVTDKLPSYGAAKRELLPDVEHRQSRYLNNRAENSCRPTRRRERQMQRFTSRPTKHSASCQPMPSSTGISIQDAIGQRQGPTGRHLPKPSRSGKRRRLCKERHDRTKLPRSQA